ncbi:class I SAM-dependent methyltransferase [Mucilaginibacter sp.]|uniref:class I SAM-dependent methyltransferase n=1 Tax=Mucilaginibacter sp. TaxID=1882438 RepID=UPI003D12751C
MIQTLKKYIRKNIFSAPVKEKGVVEAYNIWADNYDAQPGNLMLDLDEIVFTQLLNTIKLKSKTIADIGCGTGRHWPEIYAAQPANLTGFDVSPGMLGKLKAKFPSAVTQIITDDNFTAIADQTFDMIVSTLTVAHIENFETAANAWSRILKTKGDLIITDFHPNALASGGKRTFKHGQSQIAVRNFVHTTEAIREIFKKHQLLLVNLVEKSVDETVKHYYQEQNALHVYEKFKGYPIIYGMHLRRR